MAPVDDIVIPEPVLRDVPVIDDVDVIAPQPIAPLPNASDDPDNAPPPIVPDTLNEPPLITPDPASRDLQVRSPGHTTVSSVLALPIII